MRYEGIEGRVAIVTGANHGIGAATARALAGCGASVLLTYLRVEDPEQDGPAEAYRVARTRDASQVVGSIQAAGGNAEAMEADLRDSATPASLFDAAERAFGPVEILVNNATGWQQDTFKPVDRDRLGRPMRALTAATATPVLEVDARGSALDDRRVRSSAHRARLRLGEDRGPHLGRRDRVPRGGVIRRRQGRARELRDVGSDRTRTQRHHLECGAPARHRHGLGDR